MDPNATLDMIADAIADAMNPNYPRGEQMDHWRTAEASSRDLDEWLKRGGFAPAYAHSVPKMIAWTYYLGWKSAPAAAVPS